MNRPRTILAIVFAMGSGGARVASARDTKASAPALVQVSPIASAPEPDQTTQRAKTADPTSLVPTPKSPFRPAFQLYAEVDLPILVIGLAFSGARFARTEQAYCAPQCDPGTLNALDRTTAGTWSPNWQRASNLGIFAVAAGAAVFLVGDEGLLPALNDSAVVAESALAGLAVASLVALAANRPRPYLYGDKAPLSERTSGDASLSYFSSHAATSFAIATSTFVAARRLHPRTLTPWIVLGLGGVGAAFVASARVLGGMHFITDSVVGALAGVSVGVLVPALHKSPVAIVPMVGRDEAGLALAGHF